MRLHPNTETGFVSIKNGSGDASLSELSNIVEVLPQADATNVLDDYIGFGLSASEQV